MPRKIEISHRTIIFTFFLMGALWFLWQIRDIVVILFVSLLVMVIINPIVRRLSKYKVPKGLSVLILYFLFIGALIVSLIGIIPALIDQTSNLTSQFPSYIQNLHLSSAISDSIQTQVLAKVGDLSGSLLGVGLGIVTNIITFLTILTFAFYLLMAREKLEQKLSDLVGEKRAGDIADFIDELEVKLGGWARGQIILMITVGVLYYIGLRVLGIPYALPIAILAGFLEIVPFIGPILGAIPALLIAFGITPFMGVATLALMFLVQQVENYVLVPKIMQRSVGVEPIVTLIALAIGLQIAGITGVLISVPVVITLQILFKRHFLI
jgi:predicted PurR-regulated permease PerM